MRGGGVISVLVDHQQQPVSIVSFDEGENVVHADVCGRLIALGGHFTPFS